jgi:hypothetical protein
MGATIRSVSDSCREESKITTGARAKADETTQVVTHFHPPHARSARSSR